MALTFITGVIALFALVLVWERPAEPDQRLRPASLLRWMMAGNWTAKLGALLLSIGSGALLRYLMLNVTYPPVFKIMAGVAIAAALGIAAALLAARPQRRAISLALSGASLAVCYLTAYSTFGFFHFVADLQGLGLLFIVASVATAVAITRRAVSIAVLAMAGAYVAPAFALHTSDPASVYGYYVAASLVTSLMVWLRGWRPLIHLSFLFTLGGALFFGWTQKFYTPDYYQQMQPLLLMLVAIHLAMPLLERGTAANSDAAAAWGRRFDQAYFLILPLTAAALTLVLAPRIRHEGILGLVGLGVLWALAAGWQQLRSGAGSVRYLGVAIVYLGAAGLLAVPDLPTLLVAAVLTCVAVAASPQLRLSRAAEYLAIGTALVSSACYVLQALFAPVTGAALFNLPFAEHLLLGVCLFAAGWSLQRRQQAIGPIFNVYAGTWLFLTLARELVRLHYGHVAELLYLATLIAIGVCAIVSRLRARAPSRLIITVSAVLLFATGIASASRFATEYLLPLMLAGQILFSLLALACDRDDPGDEAAGAVARSVLPLLLLPWALPLAQHWSAPSHEVVLTLLVSSALSASLQAQWLVRENRIWPNWLSPVGFVFFGIVLFYETLFHIEREPWAVAFELIALIYLAETARYLWVNRNRDAVRFGYVATAAVATVSAAMLLRMIGPPGTLTILALDRMILPAFVSLLWAAIGGLLTWLATRNRSRMLWSVGAVLMLAAALKLILLDFGSLGQIANILAMMGAGGVFLLVAWLAPFPPRNVEEPKHKTLVSPPQTADKATGGRGWLWVVAALAVILLYAYWSSWPTQHAVAVPIEAPPPLATPAPQSNPAAPVSPAASADDACQRFTAALPTDYLVYGAGDALDTASTVNIRINGISQNIVLALGSQGPTLWRIQTLGSANLVGVILSGIHRSSIIGLPVYVPVLRTSFDDNEPCGYFRVHPDDVQGANRFVSKLLVHAVDGYFQPDNHLLLIGTAAADRPAQQPMPMQMTPRIDIGAATYSSSRNGRSLDVTGIVRSRCQGATDACTVHCGNELAGDPDFGQSKSCQIIYSCANQTHAAKVMEGMNLQLRCN